MLGECVNAPIKSHFTTNISEYLSLIAGWIRVLVLSLLGSRITAPGLPEDLNPIEMAFAKLKGHLTKATARNVAALWQAVGSSGYLARNRLNASRHQPAIN